MIWLEVKEARVFVRPGSTDMRKLLILDASGPTGSVLVVQSLDPHRR
jgi:hypothetical protein